MTARDFAVSLANATVSETRPGTLAGVFDLIIGPTLAAATATVRAAPDAEARGRAKRALPGFIAAGIFAARRRDAWEAAAGLLVADFDHVPDLNRLRASLAGDPCVALAFTSPSGEGVKAVLRVPVTEPDPVQHARAFLAASRWARELHGADLDPSGKDASRLCFICHDPAAIFRPDAKPLDLDRWAPAEPDAPAFLTAPMPAPADGPGVTERARAYLASLPPSIADQQGHACLFRAATALIHGFCLPAGDALGLLHEYNGRSVPAWETSDLLRKLDQPRTAQHREPPGWLRDAPPPAQPRPAHSEPPADPGAGWASERLLAERLASGRLARELRVITAGPDAGWRRWSGSHWAACFDAVPLALAAAVHEAAADLMRSGQLDLRTARGLESTASLRAILTQCAAHPEIQLPPETVDPPRTLATPSGLVNLDTGSATMANPAGAAFTRQTAVVFDPGAMHPAWDAVAAHVAAQPLGEVVRRFMGASLLGLPPDRKLLVLVGQGADGKSTLLRSCCSALGGFAAVLPAEAVAGGGRGAHGHELLSPLAGARLAVALETGPDLDWGLLKSVSGGDPRTTKRLHGRAFAFQPRAWIVLATNEPPRIPDQAAADRVILAKFAKPEDPDPAIAGTLGQPGAERDALLRACLRWMVDGCRAFLAEGLGVPDFARPDAEPEGLAAWWQSAVDAAAIVPDRGWSPLAPIRESAALWHDDRGQPPPTDTALGMFLRSRLPCRRDRLDGRRVALYRCTVDGVGRG